MTIKYEDGIPSTLWRGAAPEGTLSAASPHNPTVYGIRDQYHVIPFLVAPLLPGNVWLIDAIQATNHSAGNAYWTASVFSNVATERPFLSDPNQAYFNFAWGLLLYPGESVVMDVNHTLSRRSSLTFTVNGAGASAGQTTIPVAASLNYLSTGRIVTFTNITTSALSSATLTLPYNPGETQLSVAALAAALPVGSFGNSYADPGLWAGAWPGTNANPTSGGATVNDGIPGAITMAFTGRVVA